MDDSRLVKQVYRKFSDHTSRQKNRKKNTKKKNQKKQKPEHLWVSEEIGEYKDWVSLLLSCVKQRDQDLRVMSLQKKKKLKLYRVLKTDLGQEEYLRWNITAEQRTLYAQLRSGSLQLRIERGRWKKELESERVCNVCLTGKVETEAHFLLECYVYRRLREKMFKSIKDRTGYDLVCMAENQQGMLDVLIGNGLAKKETRSLIGEAVALFLVIALRLRARILKFSVV